MVLSKRERLLAIGTMLVLGALALNAIVIDPLAQRRAQTANEKLELEAQLAEAQNTFNRRKLLERKWKSLRAEGIRTDADAESRIARALNEWAGRTRLQVASVKPDRRTGENGMSEITFAVAGEGTLQAVASFLYQVETAELPVKVTSVTLGSRSESGDSMSLDLRISAVYVDTTPKAAEPTPQPKQPEANDDEQLL
jgi:hypothetical protein